jgi:DHA3 family macrolide efflux protein-like MFS transporter
LPIQEFKLLKNRNLLLFTLASSVSQLGDRINNMAILSLLGTHALGSQEYSLLAVWTVIPVLFFGPIAGAITDRFNRKALMIIGDFVRAFFGDFPNIYL